MNGKFRYINLKFFKIFFFFFSFQVYLFFGFAKHKIDNIPTLRPFLYISLGISVSLIILLFIFVIAKKIKLKKSLFSLIIILFFFLIAAKGDSRATKDTLFFIVNILGSFSFLMIAKFYLDKFWGIQHFFAVSVLIFSLLGGIVAVFIIINVGTEYSFLGLPIYQNYWTAFRLHGYFGEPTSLGCLLGLALIIHHKAFINSSYQQKFVFVALWILLLATGSRNSILSVIVSFFVINTLNLFKQPVVSKKVFMYSVVIFLLFIGTSLIFVYQFSEQVSSYLLRGLSSNSENRMYHWRIILTMINDRALPDFLFGSGLGTLGTAYRSAFNAPIELFYNVGGLGLAFVVIIFCYWLGIFSRQKVTLLLFIYLIAFNQFVSWFPTDGFNAITLALSFCFLVIHEKRSGSEGIKLKSYKG